jgi:hypothetical protein
MLIKKTDWLELRDINFINKKENFWVCADGPRKIFRLPENTRKIRFYIYDEPTAKSTRIKIVENINLRYWEIAIGNMRISADHHFMSQERLQELAKRQRFYYAECEYQCFTKHEYEVWLLKSRIKELEEKNQDLRDQCYYLRAHYVWSKSC